MMIELIYDGSNTLPSGFSPPNFEEYKAELAKQIKKGSVTIGQEEVWEKREAEKENNRRSGIWSYRREDCYLERFRPYGNPGPGEIAVVDSFQPKSKIAWFRWDRDRLGGDRWDRKYRPKIACNLDVHVDKLFNVSAYKPGDYLKFFNDPRTRQNYLEWAPVLLLAEEFHAGNVRNGDFTRIQYAEELAHIHNENLNLEKQMDNKLEEEFGPEIDDE